MQKNTEPKLSELILFFGEQGKMIKNGFLKGQDKAGTRNIHGEERMALDKWAHNVVLNGLQLVCNIAIEERTGIIEKYGVKALIYDPRRRGGSVVQINIS